MDNADTLCAQLFDIRVISLQDSQERRDRVARKMQEFELPFAFFQAIDARQITPTELTEIKLQHRPYNGMSLGTIAVGKSHYEVIKNWAKTSQSEYLIVMEDDAEITDDFKKFVNSIHDLRKLNFAILKIGGRYQKNKRLAYLVQDEGIKITYPLFPSFCNVAYLVNRSSVERVIAHLNTFNCDIDEKITKDVRLGLPVYEVSPFIVEESGLPSTLSGFSSTRRRIAFLPLRRLVNNFHIAKHICVILLNHILFSRQKLRLVKIR